MPRKSKTHQELPVATLPNAPYGQGVESARSQKAVPLPDNRQAPTPQGTVGTAPLSVDGGLRPGVAPAAAPGYGSGLFDAAAAFDFPQGGLLAAPTARPDEATTMGLARPAPVALPSPAQRFAEVMAQRSSDPFYVEMLRRLGG